MRISVVGAGVAGLAVAHILRQEHDIVVFEAADRPGGHARTIRVDETDATHRIDMGVDGRLMFVGGGARSAADRQVVADLTGRTVLVPAADELVARGAAIQAAAVLARCPVDDVAAAWGSGPIETIRPDPSADGAAIRAAYAEAVQEH